MRADLARLLIGATILALLAAGLILRFRQAGPRPVGTVERSNRGDEQAAPCRPAEMLATDQAGLPPSPPALRIPSQDDILFRLSSLDLSPSVQAVVGLVPGKADWKSRSKALNELTTGLSAVDVEGLTLFLQMRYDERMGISPKLHAALRNDALDILLRQERLPEGLGAKLAAMYRDGEQGDVWRDYCVQYLAGYYDRRFPADAEKSESPEREAMLVTYWEAAEEKDKTLAGTALIGLEDLSRRHGEVDRRKVSDRALELALDEECSEASRITALRLCGSMGRREALPAARILAQTGETTTLRMAAIATLGDLGGEDDIPLLESLAGSSEERVARIAGMALENARKAAQGTNAVEVAASAGGGAA